MLIVSDSAVWRERTNKNKPDPPRSAASVYFTEEFLTLQVNPGTSSTLRVDDFVESLQNNCTKSDEVLVEPGLRAALYVLDTTCVAVSLESVMWGFDEWGRRLEFCSPVKAAAEFSGSSVSSILQH
ncbi:unnamed protein product [Pleuronectes platessa]|uniref:Uncharacterized protein n=1 Tax=Pleuronectes platessa TaxID=8262 RepID=A0A9N7YT97_PLEPL|nr:unnamed protein product [Pleuronectes platessa]